jgi:preprotein translocase subunit SecG
MSDLVIVMTTYLQLLLMILLYSIGLILLILLLVHGSSHLSKQTGNKHSYITHDDVN